MYFFHGPEWSQYPRAMASSFRAPRKLAIVTALGLIQSVADLALCCAVVCGQVLAYIESGGDLNRRLCAEEVSVLSHDNSRIITPGMVRARDTLVDICLRFQREEMLKALCPNEVPEGAVKRLPSHQFPLEASSITKEVSAGLEASLNGSYDPRALGYLQLNFAVPCEIRSFSEEARRAIMMEIVDMDARDTLEDEREPVINWYCCCLNTASARAKSMHVS